MGEEDLKTIGDDLQEDLDVYRECTGTWKVACYGAWCPQSDFWEDFLEGEWEEGAYTPRACCLRFMCGMLFCFFAPIWCCKALIFCLLWPWICCWRALREGNCNKDYCRMRRSRKPISQQQLAYIESPPPTHPGEVSRQFSASRGVPPESPIPEIRIETELENGTYVTSPVEDYEIDQVRSSRQMPTTTTSYNRGPTVISTNGWQVPTTTASSQTVNHNGHQISSGATSGRVSPTTAAYSRQSPISNGRIPAGRRQYPDEDRPPLYPMSESPRGAHNHSPTRPTPRNHSTTTPPPPHPNTPPPNSGPAHHDAAKKTMSTKAKGLDNNLYRAVVMEGFQGITGKVTTV